MLGDFKLRNWFIEQLAMYAAYHQDGRNQATHHIGVPMIVFSLLVLSCMVSIPLGGGSMVPLSIPLISAMLLLYLVNVPLIGAIATIKYGLLTMFAVFVCESAGSNSLWWGVGLFVLGWAIQFIGHVFEGRKPALFDNLTQVFMAPAFLIAEVLFSMGLCHGLHGEILARRGRYEAESHDVSPEAVAN